MEEKESGRWYLVYTDFDEKQSQPFVDVQVEILQDNKEKALEDAKGVWKVFSQKKKQTERGEFPTCPRLRLQRDFYWNDWED